jgi:hypothetical protein
LWASLVSPMPGRKGSGEVPGTHQLDRPGSQGVTPSDLTEVPAGEGNRVVDDHDQCSSPPGYFSQISASPRSMSSQLRLPGPDRVG